MRPTPIAAAALALTAVCAAACDDAALQGPRDARPKDHSNPFGWALGPDCIDCTRESFGPLLPEASNWEPGRVVLFSANVGASAETRRAWLQSLLAPRHRFYAAENDFGPALAHPPPYDDEIYDLLDARGITASQAFDDAQFTAPQAVMMVMTLRPGDTPYEGSSFDFEQGPIIPNFFFPIAADAELYRDGRLVSTEHSVHLGPNQFMPPVTVSETDPPAPAEGVSHMFLTFAANGALGGSAPLGLPDGNYEYRVTLTDGWVRGWIVRVPFKVGKGGVPTTPGRVSLVPDANGAFDGTNAAGVRGTWWAGGDAYGADGSLGGGSCPMAGFPLSSCSMFQMPAPGEPFRPDSDGRMCVAGVVAPVPLGGDGMPAWSAVWGTILGFNLAVDDAGVAGPYDAVARGFTGFAFDIDNVPPGGHLRVQFATPATNLNAAYWNGATADLSPIIAPGHYEISWPQIGGPMYLGPGAPPFDPRMLSAISLHVVANQGGPVPFHFCVSNTAFLTGGAGGSSGQGGAAGQGGASGRGGAGGSSNTGVGGMGGMSAPNPGPAIIIPDLIPLAADARASTVVGISRADSRRAVRWTAATGTVPLPLARASDDTSRPTGISGDGRTIVGWSATEARSEAVRWPDPLTVERLGFARAGDETSEATAISADGTTIIGTSGQVLTAVYGRATFRWKSGVMMEIPPLPGDDGSAPRAVSLDGSTIAGVSWSVAARSQRAFVWRDGIGTEEVAPVGGANQMEPRSLSADGSVLVGDALYGTPDWPSVHSVTAARAFRWTRATGVVLLTDAGGMARVAGLDPSGDYVAGALDPGVFFSIPGGLERIPPPPTVRMLDGLVADARVSVLAGITLDAAAAPAVFLFGRRMGRVINLSSSPERLISMTEDARTLVLQSTAGAMLLPLPLLPPAP